MKKLTWMVSALALSLMAPAAAFAETTVTVDDNRVSVKPAGSVVVSQNPPATMQVIQPVVMAPAALPNSEYDIEGQIVNIDQPNAELVVRDVMPHDRRIRGDRGIVSTLKVGDYVYVKLRNNSTDEAFRIIER